MHFTLLTNECSEVDQIPLIDLSQLLPQAENGDHQQEAVHIKLRKACEEWGCFQVVNHGIGEDLLQSLDSVSRDLVKLPKERKEQTISSFLLDGYVGPSPINPLSESFCISGVPLADSIQRFSDQMWPHGNHKFCKTMQEYSHKIEDLAQNMYKNILTSLGMIKYYTSQFEKCIGRLRINLYSVFEQSSESLALLPHTDSNCVAILYQDSTGGLQVLNKAGEWVTVKPVPNSFLVIIGDSLQAWSNSRIRSVKHRVIVQGWKSRLSLGFFSLFPDDMEIIAPAELIDNEHPRRYRPFIYSDYRKFRVNKESPLDLFAGLSTQ